MELWNKSALAAVAGMAFCVGGVQAASAEATLFPGLNQLSDNSAEELINVNGGTDTILEVGDRLRGIFRIDSVESLSGGGDASLLAGSGNSQLSGIFDVTVVRKILQLNGNYTFIFGATASFAAEVNNVAGAAVAFYDGGLVYDYNRISCGTTGQGGTCEANITNGSLLWVAGFGGDAFWLATDVGTDDLSVVSAGGSTQIFGGFNLGQQLLANYGTRQFNDVVCTNTGTGAATTGLEFCGSGSILGATAGGVKTTPYDSFDNVDFTISVVPEPASIALTGLALLGLAATSRRRKA